MLNWFRNRKLGDALNETKLVIVHGVRFRIRRIDPDSYLKGEKSLLALADTYKTKGQKAASEADDKRVRQHYEDVLMAGVVSPALCRKPEAGGMLVSNMFTDPDLVLNLYAEIVAFTYRKKKSQLFRLLAQSSENSTPSQGDMESSPQNLGP